MNGKWPKPRALQKRAVELEEWINRTAPLMQLINNKHTFETPLEQAVIETGECAWRLLRLMRRVSEELAAAEVEKK